MAVTLTSGITPIWPISVETYHEIAEKGILHSGDPVELLEGIIVQKLPKTPPHSFSNAASQSALQQVIPHDWFVRAQEPITLSASEPEPDIAIIRGDPRDYLKRHPGPDEIGLVVEIADSSLERDRILKKRIYAAAGISYYWLLNLKTRSLEVYSVPQGNEDTRRVSTNPSRRWTWCWMERSWELWAWLICFRNRPSPYSEGTSHKKFPKMSEFLPAQATISSAACAEKTEALNLPCFWAG